MRHSTIFKSRWMALLWAAGILWFAYDVAGGGDDSGGNNAAAAVTTDATGAPVSTEDEQKLAEAIKNL